MSNDKKNEKTVSRRDTLKLATAVSALGVGLGAALGSKDASADGCGGAIHMLKLDGLKLDRLVLTIHKDDAGTAPLHAVDVTPLVTQNLKFAPGTYYLKLTGMKAGAPVVTAIDQFSVKI
jgi:hypothetical protein